MKTLFHDGAMSMLAWCEPLEVSDIILQPTMSKMKSSSPVFVQ
jgi:hypothetical protein